MSVNELGSIEWADSPRIGGILENSMDPIDYRRNDADIVTVLDSGHQCNDANSEW